MILRLWSYLVAGGWVMPPLVVVGLLLWYLLALRTLHLAGAGGGALDAGLSALSHGERPAAQRGVLGAALQRVHAGLGRSLPALREVEASLTLDRLTLGQHRRPVRALVTVAPLLGLLGTVSGMIETFASLGDAALFSRSGGIAGGISVALVSTQMGLLVAIPGLLAGRALDARQRRLESQLHRLATWLSAHMAARLAGEAP
ncbi:MAG: MotA/TolQ/ExbB proton channel family protein [Pseudomonadota bacterium]